MSAGIAAAVGPLALVAVVAVGCFGLLIGSFLNVVAYRVPLGISVVRPASACPGCGREIRARDNIPVLSWMMLRGRCRDCRNPISARYPLVEAGTCAFFVIVTVALAPGAFRSGGVASPVAGVLELCAYLYLGAISIALTLIDIDTHRLPNAIVLPAYLVGGVLLGTAAVLGGEPARLIGATAGLAVAYCFYFVLWLVYPRGMGLGDVKLAGVLGMFLGYLGWGPAVVGLFAAFVLGGIFAIVLLALRVVSRTGGIAFGPWMLAGAWLGIFAGEPIVNAYATLVGLAAR